MPVTFNQAPEPVTVALAEETDPLNIILFFDVVPLERVHIQRHLAAIDERPDELAVVEQVHPLRRRIDVVHVACVQIVGRQELADQYPEIKRCQEYAGYNGKPVLSEFPPHQPQLRRLKDLRLLRRHRLDRLQVKGRGGNVVLQWSTWSGQGRMRGHLVLPPCKRIRGSSSASARSEIRTPMTVRKARNMRNDPARYMSWLCSALISI